MRRSLILFLLLLGSTPLGAQFPPEIRGRITEAESGAPIPGARVEVLGGTLHTTSGVDGEFQLWGVLPGVREIRVSAFGFQPATALVEASNGRTVWLPMELRVDAVVLEGIRVEAERTPGATVLDRARIDASGARELGELLREQPGITITRRGGPGSPAHLSIRGSSADEVLILLDGVPINAPLTGEADLSTVPLEAVERVTILRGAQSARFGPHALAGVIAIQSRRPAETELSARIRAGSWRERIAALSVGGRADRGGSALSGLVTGEWQESRGDFPYPIPAVRGGGLGVRRNADARSANLLAAGSVRLRGAETGARVGVLALERGMPGSVVQISPDARQDQHRLFGGVSAAGKARGVEWKVSSDAERQRAEYRDPDPPLGPPYDEHIRATGIGASVSAGGDLGPVALSGGAEARRLRFASTLLAPGAPSGQVLAGTWAQTRWLGSLGRDWTTELVSTLRVDASSLLDVPAVSPRVEGSVGRGLLSVRLSAGSAFSPPSLADQFFQEGVLARPNPALRPERVRWEIEAGTALRDTPVGPIRVDAEVAVYRADVDGMILWFPDHRFIWQPDNFDVRRAGWEASAHARLPFARAELRGSMSHSAVEYAGGALEGQVIFRPRWTASGGAAAEAGGIRGDLSARWIGERRTVPGYAHNSLPPHWLADLRLGIPFSLGRWRGEGSLAVENLLDRSAAMLIDYPYPGRTWSLELRVRHQPRRTLHGGLFPASPKGE